MPKSEGSWSDLHDATLLRVEVVWESGMVTLHVKTASTPGTRVIAFGARLLECPRRAPWGPSVSINEVRGPARTPDGLRNRIEMELQSGDTLVIEAERFQLTSSPP